MGMYDTLNGEQVKCFPWFSFYVSPNDDTKCCITNHDGNLGEYGNGNEIPYRSLAYNYGKDFFIFDDIRIFDFFDGRGWIAVEDFLGFDEETKAKLKTKREERKKK